MTANRTPAATLRSQRYQAKRRERMKNRALAPRETALMLILHQYHAVTRSMIYPIAMLWGLTMEKPTGNTMVSLEGLGLVSWLAIPNEDGSERTRVLVLTEKGRALAAQLHAETDTVPHRVNNRLPENQ